MIDYFLNGIFDGPALLILNDFLQKRIQGWGEHSQEESQTLNNGQIGGKLSQLALFWRIIPEGGRQTESKRERGKK